MNTRPCSLQKSFINDLTFSMFSNNFLQCGCAQTQVPLSFSELLFVFSTLDDQDDIFLTRLQMLWTCKQVDTKKMYAHVHKRKEQTKRCTIVELRKQLCSTDYIELGRPSVSKYAAQQSICRSIRRQQKKRQSQILYSIITLF